MITFDPKSLSQALYTAAETLRAEADAPATVVQFAQGNLSVKAAAGVTDLDRNRPAGADQTFEIGSQTKMMTSVVILQLAQDGLIDLDARAADYLPAETIAGLANADVATVRQLLNMTAGIPNYTEAVDADGLPVFARYLLENPNKVFGPDQALAIAREMAATNAPGAAEHYSNTNYALLGEIIERLTGQSFIEAMQTHVFDPAGMTHAVRQLSTDDPRLSSYTVNPLTGELIDVTRAQWEMRGEAGVVANTSDMIAFLTALLEDQTLLGAQALAEMTKYYVSDSGPGFDSFFGLGLVKITLEDGSSYAGFTGGTFATESSTYMNTETGAVVSLAGTSDAFNSALAALAVATAFEGDAGWQPVVDDGSALRVRSGSAQDMRLQQGAEGLVFQAFGASLTLQRDLAAVTTGSLRFADGSVFVVGDNDAGTVADQQGNLIDIARDFAAALARDNHLMGLGGADTLQGGAGDDWLQGGKGRDVLRGGAGDDLLAGGGGADVFVFADADAGRDVIRDFAVGRDRVDLSGLTAFDVTEQRGNTVITAGDLTVILQGVDQFDPDSLIM